MKGVKSEIILTLFLIFIIAGCIGKIPDSIKPCLSSNENKNPNMLFNPEFDYQCVLTAAIRERNHRLCFHLGTLVDGSCVQEYYESINNPTICMEELGGMENCIHYYYLKETCNSQSNLNQECANTYSATVNRPDFCLSLPNEKECVRHYFTSKKNHTICDQLWEEYADTCRQYYATNDQNRP